MASIFGQIRAGVVDNPLSGPSPRVASGDGGFRETALADARPFLRKFSITLLSRVCLVLAFFLLGPFHVLAQTDPLNSAYLPAIDTNCANYPSNIWVTSGLYKLRQDSGTAPACPGTFANKWGTFYGTQNEFVDFQVHFHDGGSGTSNYSVTLSNFVQTSPKSYTINCATPGQCVVYREAYVNIQKFPTNTSSSRTWNTYYGTTGRYPDILIPAVDPYWKQTTNAFPFNIPAGNNQSVWIDVLIPQGAPAGYYKGAVTVSSGSTTLATIPINIAVWQWPSSAGGSMPSTTTLKIVGNGSNWGWDALCTQMYSPGGSTLPSACGNYPGAGGNSNLGQSLVELDADLLMKDHRYPSNSTIYGTSVSTGSFSSYNGYLGPLMNGTCNLHNGSATTCPLLSGSKETTRTLDSAASAAVWSNWYTNFSTQGWGSTLFNYLVDEPSNCTYVTNGNTNHGYITPGIPNLVTTDYNSANSCGALNTIDWMVAPIVTLDSVNNGLQNLSNYRTWLAGSSDGIPRQWMSYQTCSNAGTCTDGTPGPGPSGNSYMTYPNYHVDGLPVANRAMEWLTYFHGQSGELYYNQDLCDYPGYYSQCVPSGVAYDPWNGIYYSGGWGDGTGIYTGSNVSGSINFMGSGVTTPIVLPSIRLKEVRDGVQDYEYLYLLNAKGQGTLVNSAIAGWITNSYTFNVNPTAAAYGFTSDLTDARMTLGNAIHLLTYSSTATPPSPPTNLNAIVN